MLPKHLRLIRSFLRLICFIVLLPEFIKLTSFNMNREVWEDVRCSEFISLKKMVIEEFAFGDHGLIYQHFMSSFYLLTVCNLFAKINCSKSCSKNDGEIGYRDQFRQHFMSSFYVLLVWSCKFLLTRNWQKGCS